MAHKAISFKVNEKKKEIVIYTNVEEKAEKFLIERYLDGGYTPSFEVKKPPKTVADMRKELADDEETLKAFNEAYASKAKDSFFKACKIYAAWKKAHKPAKKKK